MPTSTRRLFALSVNAVLAGGLTAQREQPQQLTFPGLLHKAEREAGNPLATYAAMLALDAQYRASPVFATIYPEVRGNYEQFLGVLGAGEAAMALPALRAEYPDDDAPIPDGFVPKDAVATIVAAAANTRLVIFGEEHHLPQTRSLYEALLRGLWQQGYRWLAAETFTPAVMAADFRVPDYGSGYYVMDPVYASAVRTAVALGYRLVAYDTAERGPPGDGSFRDRTQAETLKRAVFDRDEDAKLVVFAGRGHAADVPPADGWTPMASVLKRLTGIDPLTVFAPTMSQRATPAEEHPLYRFATAHGLVPAPVVFVGANGAMLGSGNCDAWVFWPRVVSIDGRPDWLVRELGRQPFAIPDSLRAGEGLRLVQAWLPDEPERAVPLDQVLLAPGAAPPALMLPAAGSFRLRAIDAAGHVQGPITIERR